MPAALLYVVFFLSGAASLLFEVLWFHQAGLSLGNSVWASSLVLAGFMGGLGLGNGIAGRWGHRVSRPLWLYAILEVVIGASGLALVYLLPVTAPLLDSVLRPFLDTSWPLNGLRLGLAFVLLLAPSTAMGATLPLLVKQLHRSDPHFGRVLGRLYGWNTLGAVLGVLAGHWVLIASFGIRGSAWVAASANGVAALVALGLFRTREGEKSAQPAPPPAPPPALPARTLLLLAAAFVCGGILLALEVVWFRFLLLFILGSTQTFATMLAVVLAGIALGGLLGSAWLSRCSTAHRLAAFVALVSGSLSVVVYAGFELVASVVYAGFEQMTGGFDSRAAADWRLTLMLSLALIFPVSLLSGLIFTLLGEALNREAPSEIRSAGLLALANTSGGMLGSLAGGFLLLPLMGIERSIQVLSCAYGVAALLAVAARSRVLDGRESTLHWAAAAALLAALLAFPSGLMERSYLQYPIRFYQEYDNAELVAVREGLNETAMVLESRIFDEVVHYRLMTNGHSMSSTTLDSLRYMKLFVYWPLAVHPEPRNALLISYGVGGTAKALTDTRELEAIDVVDVSRDILELSRVVHQDPRDDPLLDPRVQVHVEDARYFLQTSQRRYDVITGEPPPPKSAGIVNLYTREYFALMRERLSEGGIVTYWLPVHNLLETEARAVIRGFCEVFGDCSLWKGSGLDWILVGTRAARGPVSLAHFTRQWRDPLVGRELRALGVERPEQLGALFMADADTLRTRTREIAPVDDDHPKRLSGRVLEYDSAFEVFQHWMNTERAGAQFSESEIVRRLWPESLRETSLEFFEWQQLIDGGGRTEASTPPDFSALHRVMTASPLRTLALWQMGSSRQVARLAALAQAKGLRQPNIAYHLATSALAERDFAVAARRFEALQRRPGVLRRVLHYRIYALCMARRLDEAEALSRRLGSHAEDPAFLRFLRATFSIPSSAAQTAPRRRLPR